ncbi:hypothetical protein G4B88_019535 [Cannabis sativa]|uniref:PA domain-containing protein n=1 Tax=Cannabis sativa TaxID=3483 RepID=A0A7J6DX85_CANSA|nr:hypothetical protein G4B88_019535 [Cannabis sativa]
MDKAISDGVHIIYLSVGANGHSPPYYLDSIAVGAFGASQHGVLVSCFAGNSDPNPSTATKIAPWILTVGASTIDRDFPADVNLGDGRILIGVSLYAGEPLAADGKLSLIYAGDAGNRYCYSGSLIASKVAGKIVVCDRGGNARVEKGSAVKLAGCLALVLANTEDSGEELIAGSHLIPATMVGQINVYDLDVNNYVAFLSSIGYDSKRISIFFKASTRADICETTFNKVGVLSSPGGLSLLSRDTSTFKINPQLPEAEALKEW